MIHTLLAMSLQERRQTSLPNAVAKMGSASLRLGALTRSATRFDDGTQFGGLSPLNVSNKYTFTRKILLNGRFFNHPG
jgi:hypothetical protein